MNGFSKQDEVQPSEPHGPGGVLGAARKDKGLDLGQTAKMLHLTAETVQHLENNAYSELPARVFIRGYLRNYARLVDLSEKEILKSFDQACPDQECEPMLQRMSGGMSVEVRSSHAIVRLVTWVIIIGVIVSVGFALQKPALDAWDKLQTMGGTVLTQSEETDSSDLLIPVLDDKSIKMVPMASKEQPKSMVKEYVIHFTGPVWVDIRDNSGEFRLTGDMQEGSSRPLQGQPPFTVMVSDYKQVAITIDAAAYDLAQHLENAGAENEPHLQFVVP